MRPLLIKLKLQRSGVLLVALASLAYLSFGLPDFMMGVAWPSISSEFGVPLSALGIPIAVLTAGYGVATFSSGRILQKLGAGTMVTAGAALMVLGLLGYAVSPNWWALLAFSAISGVGVGAIDGGLNVYAALNFSARSTNWMHGFYALGAAAGPVIMTGFLVSGADWQWGFVAAAGAPFILAIAFGTTRSLWQTNGDGAAEKEQETAPERAMATLRLPAAWLGIAIFILYTGLEVTAGQWTFTLLTEERGISAGAAGTWVTVFFAGLTAGRMGLGTLTKAVSARRLLRFSIVGSVLAAALFWLDIASWATLISIFTLGLSFGPVFPSLISTTPARLGRSHTPNAVGFQVSAAAAGAALMPAAVGVISDATSLEAISASLLAGTAALFVLYEVTERLAAR